MSRSATKDEALASNYFSGSYVYFCLLGSQKPMQKKHDGKRLHKDLTGITKTFVYLFHYLAGSWDIRMFGTFA